MVRVPCLKMKRLLPFISYSRASLSCLNNNSNLVGKLTFSQCRVPQTLLPWHVNYSRRSYARHPGTILRKTQELLSRLTPSERSILLRELQAYEKACSSMQLKEHLQNDTITNTTSITDDSGQLSSSQLRLVALASAIPFIGFGFLDNFIMIVAGDYIDCTLGTKLAISTMAAAALGNLISDVAGVGSAWYVESLALKVGVIPPILTPIQLAKPITTWCIYLGKALGVTIGCILGMIPLLFLPNVNDKKNEIEIDKLEMQKQIIR